MLVLLGCVLSSAFNSTPDLLTALADLIVSAKFSPNKKESIFVLVRCSFISFLRDERMKCFLVVESLCWISQSRRVTSISFFFFFFFSNSLSFSFELRCDDIISPKQDTAEAICICLASMPLSRFIAMSASAALISGLILGAPM